MNNKRKDILKKGIDVTLYPLPFRKGGKIMNANLGDRTVKPGIEMANGGPLPKINDLGKAKIASDATRMMTPKKPLGAPNQDMGRMLSTPGVSPFNPTPKTITKGGSWGPHYGSSSARRAKSKFALGGVMNGGNPIDPPVFKTQAEHDEYYRNKILKDIQTNDPERYTALSQRPNGLDDLIVLSGGIPKWTPPPSTPSTQTPTNFGAIGFSPQKTGGFQYDKGLPAKGSVTNMGLGKRRSKFTQ